MPWIQTETQLEIDGKPRPAGYRTEVGTFAARALQSSGVVVGVNGPYPGGEKYPPEPTEEPKEDQESKEDSGGLAAEELLGKEEPDGGPDLVSAEEFEALDKTDQKDLIRALGLEDDCDLRKSESMAKAYAEEIGK